MRIAKLVVALTFTLATGLAVYAQDDFDLDALLDDIQEDSTLSAVDDDATEIEEPMKGADDLLDELLADTEESAEPMAADAVDTDILDMLGTDDGTVTDFETMADEMAGDGEIEHASGDLDDLLAGDDDGDEADDAGSLGALFGELDEEVAADPSGTQDGPEDSEVEMTEIVAPAEVVVEESATAEEDAAEARELSAAEVVRLRAQELDGQEQMEKGFDALSDKRYADAAASFGAALRMIPVRPANQADLESARWGLAESNTKVGEDLLKAGDCAGALETAEVALSMVPNHRGAVRLQKKAQECVDRGPRYIPVSEREDVIALRKNVEALLYEGRDYFENGRYEDAERLFEQVRLIDEHNKDAMRFLERIEDRRFELADKERDRTVAAMVAQVRDNWNPPIRRDIAPPEMIKDPSSVPTVDEDREALVAKMSSLIIPNIQFRDTNITDVIEELRVQSEKSDPEGLGINMVLKLQSNLAPPTGITTPGTRGGFTGQDPFFDDGFGGGRNEMRGGGSSTGFGDTGFDDGFGDTGFDDGFGSGFADETFTDPGLLDATAAAGPIPPVTLTLRRISLLEALKIITEYADLKYKIENGIVFITPINQITDPLETRVYAVQPSLLRVIMTAEENDQQGGGGRGGGGGGGRGGGGGGGSGQFIEMGQNITTERVNARQFFSDAGVPFPPGTTIFYNEAISQLVVRNTIENLEIFERLLPKFNVPPPQVEIEARFVEILHEDLQELGLEWILTDNWELASNTSQGPLANRERVQFDADENGITSGLRFLASGAAGTEATTRAGGGSSGFVGNMLSFSSVLTNPEINVVLHAIEQQGGSDLLSAPRIVTRSGINATIEVVQEIIYPTEFEAESASSRIDVESAGDTQINNGIVIFPETFETREVGVILNVTPTVGPDNYTIDLTLSPEVSELVDWIQYGTPPFNIPQPIFASRNATTSIVIWDGQTVAMGGLINEDLQSFEDKIPIIGDIPLIGRFFSSEGQRSVKRNLLIFVSARIVDPAGRPVNQTQATTILEEEDNS